MRRVVRSVVLGVMASLLLASTAAASHCVNANKVQAAGAQVVIDLSTGQIVWLSAGVVTRIDQGLIDPATGEGFHGLIAFDGDGDGVGDLSTWVGVGPDGSAVPWQAQVNGPACSGVTDIETYFAECLGN
jgi:hypothetical protein